MINYYEVLQIDPKADQAVIRAAYRTLMKELHNHPDHGGNTEDAQRINEAYSNLIDPQKRRMVDQRIRRWYSGLHQREKSNTGEVRYIRCAGCGATNRVYVNKLHQNTMVQCGVCRSVLLCSDSSSSDSASKPMKKMLMHLTHDKWSYIDEKQHYFDAVLQNEFFLKNFLYIKKISVLTRDNVHDIAQICKNTWPA